MTRGRLNRLSGRSLREGQRSLFQARKQLRGVEITVDREHQAGDAGDDRRREAGAEIRVGELVRVTVLARGRDTEVEARAHRVEAGCARSRVDTVACRGAQRHFGAQAAEADLGAGMAQACDADRTRTVGRGIYRPSLVSGRGHHQYTHLAQLLDGVHVYRWARARAT